MMSTCDVGVVSRRRGGRLLMLDVARYSGRNMGSLCIVSRRTREDAP
jgi:hypothetical protein